MVGKLDRDFKEEELNLIQEQKNSLMANYGNQSSRNSYILDSPELKDLKDYITVFINHYVQEIYIPKYPVEAYITQSWLNYTEIGQYHHMHSHPNSFISGVIYINAERSKDSIKFHNPSTRQLVVVSQRYNIVNGDAWGHTVESKDIVLFPSNLPHSVEMTETDTTRVSLAFNSFLSGTLGEGHRFNELKL
jgi:uncharacterized protein (TIGR02466 family)